MSTSLTSGNFSANAQSASVSVQRGNKVTIHAGSTAAETFGSGTIEAQISFDGGTTWFPHDAADNLTSTGRIDIPDIKRDYTLRLDLTGATTPDIDYVMNEAPA